MTGPNVRNCGKKVDGKNFIFFITMSTKIVREIPAALTGQMTSVGFVNVPLGNKCPFDGRLTDLVIEEDTVVLQIKITWWQKLADNSIAAFGEMGDAPAGTTWDFNSVISRSRFPKSMFTDEQLAHFERLELYWASLPKDQKRSLKRDCPWMETNGRNCAFKLDGHRARELSIVGVTFNGRASGMDTEERSGALDALVFTNTAYPAAVPMATAPAAPTAPTSYTVPAK